MSVAADGITVAGIPPAPSERQMDRLVSVVAELDRQAREGEPLLP